MHRKRIIIIGPHPERSKGGMATVIHNIINNETILDSYDVSTYPSYIDGGIVRRGLYSIARGLLFALFAKNYDVYHIHICSGTSTWRKMRYVQLLGENSSKVILHVHGARYHMFYEQCTDQQRKKIRQLFSMVAKVIVLSEEWRDWFIQNNICDPSKLIVMYNAVTIPEENHTDYELKTVLFMGRLDERKSPDILLEAAAKVIPSHPDARFVFGGDGSVDKYRRMAEALKIERYCDFLGWVSGENKVNTFQSSSIYCLPSKDEGMPMSVLEAMSFGLATISTPVGGMPQVIEDGKDGVFFPVDDVNSLVVVLDSLLSSRQERERLGCRGRAKIDVKFGFNAYIAQLISIYEEVAR